MIIGIDFGTTNSLSAYINDSLTPEVIINEHGKRLTPSVVYFKSINEAFVGELAYSKRGLDFENTVFNVKRKIGKDFKYIVYGRDYTPLEVSSLILKKIKSYSEAFLKKEVRDAVLTVPAYFSYKERAAVKRAAEIAGLNVLKIINEPTASALAYNVFDGKDKRLAVIDLGGGTLDVTIIDYKDRVQRVLALGGDTNLGGFDFDRAIAQMLIDEFKSLYDVSIEDDPLAVNELYRASKKAKEDLSFLDSITITIPYITITKKGPLHLKREIIRDEFQAITSELTERIVLKVEETFEKSNISPSSIDNLLFVGGATRIPVVRERIVEFFKKHGFEDNGVVYSSLVNPDEAVAIGAAVYAGMLEGRINDIEIFDITSYYLGIEDDDGKFVPIVSSGETYPLERAKVFTTVKDNQEFIKVKVLQSEDEKGEKGTNTIGYFYLEGIPPQKAGEPDIDVVFIIDKNGILNVKAVELDEGNYREIKIYDFHTTEDFRNQKRGSGIKVF